MTRTGSAGLLSDVPANVKLILCLIHELHLGAQSPWAPYLQTLPSCEAGIPLLWPQNEARELLRGTELDEHCESKRRELASEWRQHVQPLIRRFPSLFPLPTYALAEYVKKSTLVSSRSFAIDAHHGPGMVTAPEILRADPAPESMQQTYIHLIYIHRYIHVCVCVCVCACE